MLISFKSSFLYLGELSQSLMYSRLQNRLNPVPESLNSPDIAPPASNDGMIRPPRDDPLRVYNRDIRVGNKCIYVMFIEYDRNPLN